MTEESDLNNLNLIEYEEFIQTETTNQNIEVDQLDIDDERQGIPEVSNILKAKENDQDSNNDSYVNCQSSNKDKENNRILLTSNDQIEYDVNNSEISNKRDISDKCDKKQQYTTNSLVKQQEITNKQPTYDNLPYMSNLPESSKKGSREVIFEEKIIHMQNIINAQREQIQQKDDKIVFLLNQIQEMNQQMHKRNAEISQTREDLNKAQQEIELLKQQQRIKDEIQNGKSQILEIEIQKEEQIIENLNTKLVASRNNSPEMTTSNLKAKYQGDNQAQSQNETNITEIKQSNSKNNKKQMEKFLNSAATTSYYNNSQIGNSLSATTQKNVQKSRDSNIKNIWNNQSQINSNQQLSAGADTTTSQNIIHQSPTTNYNQSELRNNLNSNNKDNNVSTNIPNLTQILNEQQQPKQNNFYHKKNTMSTDCVYKREPLAQTQIQNIQSNFNLNSIQDGINEIILPNKIHNNFQKQISNTNLNGGINNYQSVNSNPYRSCSNHTSNFLTNNSAGNKQYQSNENRVKDFYEKSNSQPPTQCSTAKGGTSLINQENYKKSESYREQYIKNIEELQKRLDFLKQKRNEYEVKPDYLNYSQSTRFVSNVQNSHKDRNFNSSISSPIKQIPCLNNKLHQSQSILLNPNNNSLISSTVNQKLNENMLVHFAQIKKLENIVPNKDSYFNKQIFSLQNSQPQLLANNILKQEENITQKHAQSPQSTQNKLNKYLNGNTNIALNYYSSVSQQVQNDDTKSNNLQNTQVATPNLDLGVLSSKQAINKQYFPVSSKQKFKNNEYSLQNNAYIMQDKVDSVSPAKVYSTRNSQNNYQSLLDNLALSASLKKEINNHKMSWDSLNLKDTSTPSNLISSGGISSSHIKHSSVTAFNKFAPISVKNSYQPFESEKNQNYFSKVSNSHSNHINNNTNNNSNHNNHINSNKCYFNMQDQLNQVVIDNNKDYLSKQQ